MMNYKKIFEQSMPVTYDSVGMEEGHEVERMWLADMVDGKWVEDYVTVNRTIYDIVTEVDGAVFALIECGRMLVKAPNVKHYRIPEDVYGIAANAFLGCTETTDIDVPYTISTYEIEQALEHSHTRMHIHAWQWAYDNTRSEELQREIAGGVTDEQGFVYSRNGKRLLRAAKEVREYWIPEGVEEVDRLAFVHCRFERLHVPHTCRIDLLPADEYPIFGSEQVAGTVTTWDRPYAEQDEIADMFHASDDDKVEDAHGVVYTKNMRRLLYATVRFGATEYSVPDGVVTICSMAFDMCHQFVTLHIPRSVRRIGDHMFGPGGGEIVIAHGSCR